MLPVWMLNCKDPDSYGVAQYCVPALVYVAKDNQWTTDGMIVFSQNFVNSTYWLLKQETENWADFVKNRLINGV